MLFVRSDCRISNLIICFILLFLLGLWYYLLDCRYKTLQWCFIWWRVPVLIIWLRVDLLTTQILWFTLTHFSHNYLTIQLIVKLNRRLFFNRNLVTFFSFCQLTYLTLLFLLNWLLQRSTSKCLIKLNFLYDFLFALIIRINLTICVY